jgi:hypothetical protein
MAGDSGEVCALDNAGSIAAAKLDTENNRMGFL